MGYAQGIDQAIDQIEALRMLLRDVANDLWADESRVMHVPDSELVHALVAALKSLDQQVGEITAAQGCEPM